MYVLAHSDALVKKAEDFPLFHGNTAEDFLEHIGSAAKEYPVFSIF